MTLIKADAVGWDFDHTLYQDIEGRDTVEDFATAMRGVLRHNGISAEEIADDEVSKIIQHEYLTNGTSFPYFLKRFGWSLEYLQAEIAQFQITDSIFPCPELPALFEKSPLRHFINTHAHPIWLERGLDFVGLSAFFLPNDRIYHCHHGFAQKDVSSVTFEAMRERAGVAFSRLPFIDDYAPNLKTAKECGMPTIWLPKRPPTEVPSYIDAVVPRAADVFTLLA